MIAWFEPRSFGGIRDVQLGERCEMPLWSDDEGAVPVALVRGLDAPHDEGHVQVATQRLEER